MTYPQMAMPPEKKSNTGMCVGIGCGCLVLLAIIIGGIVLAVTLLGGDDSKDSGGGEATTTSAEASKPGSTDNTNDGSDNEGSATPEPTDDSEGSATPEPTNGNGGSSTPEPKPTVPAEGGREPVKALGGEPQKFADFVLVQSEEPHKGPQNFDIHAVYEKADGSRFEVGAGKDTDRDAATVAKGLPSPQKIGKWTCGVEESLSGCVTQDGTHGYVAIASKDPVDPKTIASWGDQFIEALNE